MKNLIKVIRNNWPHIFWCTSTGRKHTGNTRITTAEWGHVLQNSVNVLESSSCDLLSADDVTKFLLYFHEETFKLQTITLETQRREVYRQVKRFCWKRPRNTNLFTFCSSTAPITINCIKYRQKGNQKVTYSDRTPTLDSLKSSSTLWSISSKWTLKISLLLRLSRVLTVTWKWESKVQC